MVEALKVVGLDIGTGNLKLAYSEGKVVKTASMRNVFYQIPQTSEAKEMLKRLKAPVFEVDDKIYLAGNDAYQLAVIFGKELQRPMKSGVINVSAETKDAVPMIGAMIERVMKEVGGTPGVCCYSCPADPIDVDIDSVVHRALIESKLTKLGWKAKKILEGHAVVLSELEQEDFTGIGISWGAGMSNCCLAFKSLPVVSFSSCHAGDWIDEKAAARMKLSAPRVTAIKESGFSLITPATLEEITVAAYYKEAIGYALEAIKRRFETGQDMPRFADPIVIVNAGGTSMANGFVEVFKSVLETLKFPLKVKEVRVAKDPLFAVSRGALISATLG